MPGVKDPKRVRKIMQSTARLEFWETYSFNEEAIFNNVSKADELTKKYFDNIGKKAIDTASTDTINSSKISLEGDTVKAPKDGNTLLAAANDTTKGKAALAKNDTLNKDDKGGERLFKYFRPNFKQESGKWYPGNGAVVGVAAVRDTARVNAMFNLPQVKMLFPRNMKLLWGIKPPDYVEKAQVIELYAIKVSRRDGQPPLDGEVLTDARYDYDQTGRVEIRMSMNSQGALVWKNLTRDNVDKAIAIVLDGYVYSAPNVQQEISGGNSQISGNFTIKEGEDLANVLKSGKLPVPARIIEEAVVGPSLGKEAINAGMISFIGAFILVLLYMWFFYNSAGLIADVSLIANIFFLFGVLASLQAVLTLPGIAGIVLTLGMAVDANVIIYERIREEMRAGKGIKLAISDGYKNAYSAIIDGNVTTILTGIVLYIFGSGPVQGFATTLVIGIITSLFSAIFISRLIFGWYLDRNRNISFETKITKRFMQNIQFNPIGWRKKAYIFSGTIIIIGLGFLFTKGLTQGVDFAGGRTYVVRFDSEVNTTEVAKELSKQLISANGTSMTPEVTTFGPTSQVKITTRYLINEKSKEIDSIVDSKIYLGTKGFYKTPIKEEEFFSSEDNKDRGKLSSEKVDPTISDDLIWESYLAIFFAFLAIFIYIALRFRKWQYGLGGLVALVHDSLLVVSMYAIFSGIFPFDMEVDQAFIAAILTIIGYSINDTVIILDRIREYVGLYPKRTLFDNMNNAISHTLRRTINTSGTTLIVLLAIFIFGGEVIRGFTFALLVGITVGTYSSVFVASPIAYETLKKKDEARLAAEKKK